VIGHVSDGGGNGNGNGKVKEAGQSHGGGMGSSNTESPLLLIPPRKSFPYIDTQASPNVTALLGKNAYLNCKVKNLGDKTVSGGTELSFTISSPTFP